MEYFDEELLEAKRQRERETHTTLKTGMYAGEELLHFCRVNLPDTEVTVCLPDSFIVMPDALKRVKYPLTSAPEHIATSVDTTVNIGFSLLPIILGDGQIRQLSKQFQTAIMNVNPAIKVQNQITGKTAQGNEMIWFDFCGYNLDGQSFNRSCLIGMKKNVLHVTFNCFLKDKLYVLMRVVGAEYAMKLNGRS